MSATSATLTDTDDDDGDAIRLSIDDARLPAGVSSGSQIATIVTLIDNDETARTLADGVSVTSSPASGDGEDIEITITFSEAVYTTGSPQIEFCMGSGECRDGDDRKAKYGRVGRKLCHQAHRN